MVRRLQIYFDSNVYRFIRARDEVRRMQDLLASFSCVIEASASNLFETFAISSIAEQRAEVETLVQLAERFEERPISLLHADELLAELRRKRPGWVRRVNFTRKIKDFLRGHLDSWRAARTLDLPPPDAYAQYRRDSEAGILNQRQLQKLLRAEADNLSNSGLICPDGQILRIDKSDPEVSWRAEGLTVWYAAIEGHSPASRDYADWLSPYLKRGAFNDPTYPSFWLDDASAEAMPLNRLTGLVSFYQLEEKITHGNAADQLHANHWLLSDLFFTADRAFFNVLQRIADRHFPDLPKPIFLDRAATSCVEQVKRAVQEVR